MASNEADLQSTEPERLSTTRLTSTAAAEAPQPRGRRRTRTVRAHSVSINRLAKSELEQGRLLCGDTEVSRPATRGECAEGERPCPFMSCKYHLYLDVSPRTGAIKLNFPDLEVSEMAETCVLDVADRGGARLVDLATVMNLSVERIRQVELGAFGRITALDAQHGLGAFNDEGPVQKRRLFVMQGAEEEAEEADDLAPTSDPEALELEQLEDVEDLLSA
jgi:hypothetical protein